ncbi:hypothetical protein HJFPF1_05870 [Paramyrothecium foliicola]|nr:hypothetical protein HJFPF1_05870 [Paramyrothecium foliicola]
MTIAWRSLPKTHRLQVCFCAFSILLITIFLIVERRSARNIALNILHGTIHRPEYLPAHNDSAATSTSTDRFAYVTFLTSTVDGGSEDLDADVYFIATRILVWQLLHDHDTKTSGHDVIVLVGPDVTESRCERLRKDGATVRSVALLHGHDDAWVVPKYSRWQDVMAKLRVWEMEEYSRILMLDGDMLLQAPLDGVFDDPGAVLLRTKPDIGRKDDEPELPQEYLLASLGEVDTDDHSWPPKQWEHGWRSDVKEPGFFNAGFFILKPDKKMLQYFVALLDLKGRFDPKYPEQNLLNYAYRWDGAMPWREIDYTWNIRWATEDDLDGGAVSLHEKWWENPRSGSSRVKDFLLSKRWAMEEYYKIHDLIPENATQ